jgi:hypothetical protein
MLHDLPARRDLLIAPASEPSPFLSNTNRFSPHRAYLVHRWAAITPERTVPGVPATTTRGPRTNAARPAASDLRERARCARRPPRPAPTSTRRRPGSRMRAGQLAVVWPPAAGAGLTSRRCGNSDRAWQNGSAIPRPRTQPHAQDCPRQRGLLRRNRSRGSPSEGSRCGIEAGASGQEVALPQQLVQKARPPTPAAPERTREALGRAPQRRKAVRICNQAALSRRRVVPGRPSSDRCHRMLRTVRRPLLPADRGPAWFYDAWRDSVVSPGHTPPGRAPCTACADTLAVHGD